MTWANLHTAGGPYRIAAVAGLLAELKDVEK